MSPGHVSFGLSVDGEMIGLLDAQGTEIDKVMFGPQTVDVSEGRVPDGAASVALLPLPTPGLANPQLQKTTTTTVALVEEKATKRVLVPTGPISDDWKGGATFDDSSWRLCAGAPGGVGYEADKGYETLITLDTKAQMYGSGKNNTCYIRIPFTVDASALGGISKLTLKMRYDDGFIAYSTARKWPDATSRARRPGTPTPTAPA